MISPRNGVAFSGSSDGDLRSDARARRSVSELLGIGDQWATLTQVHGAAVIEAVEPGPQGEADAAFTRRRGLPLAVFTADCLPVVVVADGAIGVAHAGWRGLASGVIASLVSALVEAGCQPMEAFIGPGIGPCCFEVGAEVLAAFPGRVAKTSWATDSVDLLGVAGDQLPGLATWRSGTCTFHQEGSFSHRRDGTPARMGGLGWMP